MELNDTAELERFFAAMTLEEVSKASYRDLDFEVIQPGAGSLIAAASMRVWYALVDWISGRKRARKWSFGRRIRIFFPRPLRLDLWIESRGRGVPNADPLRAAFYWPAIAEEIIRQLFEGTRRSDLLQLGARVRILINNEWLQCGPLPPSPLESADILDRAAQIVDGLHQAAESLRPAPSEF